METTTPTGHTYQSTAPALPGTPPAPATEQPDELPEPLSIFEQALGRIDFLYRPAA
ncbi:hypothetical protein [Arthrobacter crystallopoietes]|uniref:hypothetical protein n=1 Tax=Crystallibacter crystallopoietes TaxID=37928 RepID=UPI001ABEDD1F|nr:hypothetical protein [Arthrobacter crystallopoietes]QTG82439.1 hypothetical protein J5251_07875 [Arthrobacter crystallopoietes]